MITIDQIEIVPVDNVTDLERVNEQIKNLILSYEGTIPGSRGFGLPGDFMDLPPAEALNVFAIELEEKCDEYIPTIDITDVTGEVTMDGLGDLQVSITRRDADNGID